MHFLAITGLVPVLVAASGIAGATPLVTEADALSQLDRNLPAVVDASHHLPLAQAELQAARTLENPLLGVEREEPDGSTTQTEWTLSWQLPDSTRRLAIAAAEQSVAAASADVEHRLRLLRSALREDYANWAVATARQQFLSGQTKHLSTLAARARASAEKGESSGLEAHRLRLAETSLKAQLSLTAAETRRSRAAVESWLPDLEVAAQPQLPALPPLPEGETESSIDDGIAHPLVDGLRAEVEAAELQQQMSRRYVASPALSVGWQRQEGASSIHRGPVVGLSWSLPLFDRKQAARGAALARLEAVRARAQITAQDLEAKRSAAKSRYRELRQGMSESEAVLDANSDAWAGAEAAFRYGELTLTDLLDIQRSVTDAHLAWLDLYAAALAAHRDLEVLAMTHTTPSTTQNKDLTP